MKHLLRVLEIIFNPFYSLITANENPKSKNKDRFSFLKNRFILLLISLLIAIAILLCIYHKELFGV